MLDTLIQGLLLGGLYALFALGLSLMFGVMRLTNIAHGDFIVLAGFAGVLVAGALGGQAWPAALLVIPIAFGLGWLLQRHLLTAPMVAIRCLRWWSPSGCPSWCRTPCWNFCRPIRARCPQAA